MESYDNQAQLQENGIVAEGALPQELREVVEGLTPDEVEVLVAVKKRLDAAQLTEDQLRPPKERPKGQWELWMVF